MPLFRKKPVVVHALQWFPPWDERHEAIDGVVEADNSSPELGQNYRYFGVATLEGFMQAHPGDWIITGVKGERYPCRDDIFRETYEPI